MTSDPDIQTPADTDAPPARPAATKPKAKPAIKVGQFVTARAKPTPESPEGAITRVGMVVGEGKEPNLNHTDEYGNPKPETRQPLVVWFALDGAPSPYGLELSPLT